jgi:hypothetical protein
MSQSQATVEQRCREAVKKAWHITREALAETGAGSNLLTALTMQAYPEVLRELLKQTDGATQAAPITSITPIPTMPTIPPTTPVPKTSSSSPPSNTVVPLQAQVFEEFLKRLPAQLRPLLRIKNHTGTEIHITNTEKLDGADFALVCHIAEEMGGRRLSGAGKDSAWILPLTRAHLPTGNQPQGK